MPRHRRRPLLIPVLASIAIHLLLIFVLFPQLRRDWWTAPEPLALLDQQTSSEPLSFEFIDMETEEETPVDDRVKLSDLDRRAHGGEGEAAERPGISGNTPQLVRHQGSQPTQPSQQSQPSPQQQPSEEVPKPNPDQESKDPQDREQRNSENPEVPEPEAEPEQPTEEPRPEAQSLLPSSRAWAQPPAPNARLELPDRDGGQVDTSALSFDTQWYDWGPYAALMLAKIRKNWRIPEIAYYGVDGVVKIRFFIERDGAVTGVQILDESGKPPMDFAARDAIKLSNPFLPLPSDLTGVDREGITITFYYNRRPPE